MNRARYFFVALLCAFLQMTIVPIISIHGIMPNLLIVMIGYYYFQVERLEMVLMGLVAGACLDICFAHQFGIHSLTLVLFSYFITLPRFHSMMDNWYNRILILGLGTIFHHIIYAVILYFMGMKLNLAMLMYRIISWELLLNITIGILAYVIIGRTKPRYGRWFKV